MLKCLALMWCVAGALVVSACVDGEPADDSTEAVAREWECVNTCFPGAPEDPRLPCFGICRLSIDEPGFQVVKPEPSCSDPRRQINVCGDGCCDADETFDCRDDCKLYPIEIVKSERDARLQILSYERPMGLVSERGVEVSQTACEY